MCAHVWGPLRAESRKPSRDAAPEDHQKLGVDMCVRMVDTRVRVWHVAEFDSQYDSGAECSLVLTQHWTPEEEDHECKQPKCL
jgi:hypothetical protein